MKFKCCRYLLSGLAFFPDRVKCCNQVKIGPPLVSDLKNLSKKQIESAREKIINDCKNGIYPECCSDCEHFREDDWEYSGKISFLAFFHWRIVIAVASIALINLILKTNSRTKFYRLFTLLQI